MTPAKTAILSAAAGAALILLTSPLSPTALPLVLRALAPFALLAALGRLLPDAWSAAGAGTAMLAVELGVRASVFLFPTSSTAAIALLFSPLLVGLAAPFGLAFGWLAGRAWRTGSAVLRTLALGALLGAFCLTVLRFARPELFPTAVIARHRMLARVGQPRVVAGAEAFETQTVSRKSAWHVVAPCDEGPDECIVLMDGRRADFLDPLTLLPRGGVELGEEARRGWNWFSTLSRVDGKLAIAQTGGGFSDTEVRGLDGGLVWRYRPDPRLPPTTLRPADLDGDGTTEFYAADNTEVVRLDGAGNVVWRHPNLGLSLVGVAPHWKDTPGWVAASAYGRPTLVWDSEGRSLGEIPRQRHEPPQAIVDWKETRVVVEGGASARGTRLDGTVAFDLPLGEGFVLSQALSVRLSPGDQPHLAVVAAAPRDVRRWRLLLFDATGTAVFEQVFDAPVRLLKARQATGTETLFLSASPFLGSLRPRPQPTGR